MKQQMYVCSLTREGGDQLSPHFKVREFACDDGTDAVFVAGELLEVLEKIRGHFGAAVVINSGYRTVSHNKTVGGSTRSRHIYGMAADIAVRGVKASEVADYAETLLPNRGGIGRYVSFTHIDVRPEKSRWKG